MGKIISWIAAWITKKALWSVVYYSVTFTYFLSIVAAIVAFFVGLDYMIQSVRDLLNFVSNYNSGGQVTSMFFGFLNCVGITQAFNNVSTFFSAALVFLFSRHAISYINGFYKRVFGIVSSLMNTGM